MRNRLLVAIAALLMVSLLTAGCVEAPAVVSLPESPHPPPPTQWSRTFGGPERDKAESIQQTACGGFIIAGWTESFGAGGADFWLVKTDPQGNKEWSRTFGGPKSDWAYSVQQTACGGFIIAGGTWSFGAGRIDFWLVKTDPEGNKEWSRTFGGPKSDRAHSVQQTACGGFIIVGSTRSFGEGDSDFWLVKTDPEGNKEWSQTFGGPKSDRARSVQQTACGGFIIAGKTELFGGRSGDLWLIKTDPQGNEEWSRSFGRGGMDEGISVIQTAEGYFVIAGSLQPSRGKARQFWLLKTDPEGNREWTRTYAVDRVMAQWAHSLDQTACGGFVIAGQIKAGHPGIRITSTLWVVRTDPRGNIKWSYPSGRRREWDTATSVQQTACGGFIIAGSTTTYGQGSSDFWLIKLSPEP